MLEVIWSHLIQSGFIQSDLIWFHLPLPFNLINSYLKSCDPFLSNPILLAFFYFISSDPIQPHILSSVLKSWPLIISKFNCCHFISSDQIYFLPIRSDPISSNIMQSCLKSCDLIWDYMVFSDLISQLESSDFMIPSESISSDLT